jgi:hypothetical protein
MDICSLTPLIFKLRILYVISQTYVATQTAAGLLTRWLNSFGNKVEEEENFAVLFHAICIHK